MEIAGENQDLENAGMPLERIKVKDWFAQKEGLPVKFKAYLIEEREKAVRFLVNNKKIWIPRSVIIDETPDKYQTKLF